MQWGSCRLDLPRTCFARLGDSIGKCPKQGSNVVSRDQWTSDCADKVCACIFQFSNEDVCCEAQSGIWAVFAMSNECHFLEKYRSRGTVG